MGQWIPLSDFGNVEETMEEFSLEGKVFEKSYTFRITNIGDFTFRLTTFRKEDYRPHLDIPPNVYEDPTDIDELVIHTPGIRIEGIYGRLRRYEYRMESLLFFFMAKWNNKSLGEFIGEMQVFKMQVRMPEGTIYTGGGEGQIQVVGDVPQMHFDDWKNEATGAEVIPAIPKEADPYINSLEIRVVQAISE